MKKHEKQEKNSKKTPRRGAEAQRRGVVV